MKEPDKKEEELVSVEKLQENKGEQMSVEKANEEEQVSVEGKDGKNEKEHVSVDGKEGGRGRGCRRSGGRGLLDEN